MAPRKSRPEVVQVLHDILEDSVCSPSVVEDAFDRQCRAEHGSPLHHGAETGDEYDAE